MNKGKLQEDIAAIFAADLNDFKKSEDLPIKQFIKKIKETSWIYSSIVPHELDNVICRLSVESSVTKLTGIARQLYGECMYQITTDRQSAMDIAKITARRVKSTLAEPTQREAVLAAKLLLAFIENADCESI